MDRNDVRADVERLVQRVSEQLSGVLAESGLPDNLRAKYESIVQANIDGLGL